MRVYKYLITLVFLIFLIPNIVEAKPNDTIPENTYYFSESGILTSDTGTSNSGMFKEILKTKQITVIDEIKRMHGEGFSTSTLDGDLDTLSGGSMWSTDLSDLYENTSGTTIFMRQGSKEYKIYIPRGKIGEVYVNEDYISDAITGILDYQDVVKEGILAGGIAVSYNVYTVYPEKEQVPVTDILEDKKDGDKRTGKVLKSTGVKMVYDLEYFMNMNFGKIPSDKLDKTQENWKRLSRSIQVKHVEKEKVTFDMAPEYITFINEIKSDTNTLTDLDKNLVTNSKTGFERYKPELTNEVRPKDVVDSAFRVIVPNLFAKTDGSKYQLANNGGYKILEGLRFMVTHNIILSKEDEASGLKRVGDFASHDIDPRGLVLSRTYIDDNGEYKEPSAGGKTVGAIIPLWYKEAVIDTYGVSKESENRVEGKEVYVTGRVFKFGDDYSGKITLNGMNMNLLSVDSKGTGKQAVMLRHYAFGESTSFLEREDHFTLDIQPEKFNVHIGFETLEGGVKGFLVYRNNQYIQEPDLLNWLDTAEAKAMTDVKAEVLREIVTGAFDMEKKKLSYEEWLRLQEIRDELGGGLSKTLRTIITVITLFFGVFIISYSILLVILYWIDIMNPLTEFSLLKFVTFGRMYPLTAYDKELLGDMDSSGAKYVTFKNVFIWMLVGITIGIVFMFSSPIIEFITWLYFYITGKVGEF